MSYILEALKKSQQGRELGTAPTVLADTNPVTGSRADLRSHAWGYLSLALAAVAVLISLYGLVQGRFSGPSRASEPVPSEASIAAGEVDRPPSAPGLQSDQVLLSPGLPASSGQVPETRIETAGSGPQSLADAEAAPPRELASGSREAASEPTLLPREVPGAEVLAPPPGLATGDSDGGVAVADKTRLPAAPGRGSSPRPKVAAKPKPAPERSKMAASQAAPADSQPEAFSGTQAVAPAVSDALERRMTERAVAAEPKIAVSSAPDASTGPSSDRAPARPPRKLPPGPGQLPPAVFQALPEARVLVHVYADQPAQRFVILNSRKLREGDTGPEGLGMEEILPEGVVLSFKGHRFFIPR